MKPVPSLTPAATHALWLKLTRSRRTTLAAAGCRPARVVFYAQTDWLRLATKLAQQASPCAQYYISVPPLAADKTQARSGQAAQIRALGSNVHALDEVSYSGWSGWVSAGSGTWYDAGVTARQRMAAAGFDAAAGDTWAMNELSSAVRTGAGNARRNALDFLHGLASDGTKGVVFAAGVGQGGTNLTPYKVNLQDWLQDGGFWSEAAAYVSDFAQENYGDIRTYAVGGSTPAQRRDAMAQYLGHELALANAGPGATASARALLNTTYVSFGNAAWAWASAYGWTAAPSDTMQDFVSGQIDAARAFAASVSAPVDRLGFAWAPSNTQGLSTTDFDNQTASILDRLAAAIRDSGAGTSACAPSWCATALDGAAFTPAWAAFSAWTPTVPVFTTAPVTTAAATPAGPLTVQLQTSSIADNAVAARTLTLASTSPGAQFATASSGPWSPTLQVTIAPGSNSASFFYRDTAGGTPVVSATLDDGNATTQIETVNAPAATPAPAPTATTAAPPATTTPAVPPATPPVAATPKPKPHVVSVHTRVVAHHVVVTATIAAGSARPAGVHVAIRVRRNGKSIVLVKRTTVRGGVATWRSPKAVASGRYSATAAVR